VITRMHARWRRFRRLFNRSEWVSRWLGLPTFPEDGTQGLVMIQIDGLSHQELQRALKKGELPFMARLMRREDYEVRRMFSGLPSNTPAVQGELFYGIPCAVPAFGFFDRKHGRVCRMFEGETARAVEAELAKKGEALLRGGSSYGNIYTGGAGEPRWCFASMGWGTSTPGGRIRTLLLLGLLNAYGFARAVVFALLEIVLGLWDALRGIWNGEAPKREFKYLLARVATCILLREWATQAAKMDVARGMPIVHLNFVGYDEQSHHRGPDSAFAHWVLKGIDDCVKRIWMAAKASHRRDYEIWIYSDHGQVHSAPYARTAGETLQDAVRDAWNASAGKPEKSRPEPNTQLPRVRLLGGRLLQKLFRVPGAPMPIKPPLKKERRRPDPSDPKSPTPDPANHVEAAAPPVSMPAPDFPVVCGMGPLGLVYLGENADEARRVELARRLVAEKQVPLVMDVRHAEGIRCWMREGEFLLPRDAEAIFGDHPFRAEVLTDLKRLCSHDHAGDLALFGWRHGIKPPVTFAFEIGAHGGISPQECSAFVALPRYLERELLFKDTLRPADFYRAAMVLQGRASSEVAAPWLPLAQRSHVRVMTYNVHSCIGTDGRHDPRRIARVIAHYHPDIIALQELDAGNPRSGGTHQAMRIAELLRLEYHFHAVREADDSGFGNAILSRFPLKVLRAGGLPAKAARRGSETRGALWVEADADGIPVQILNTHLGLWPRERLEQARALAGPRWLGGRRREIPLIVCGDLNCGPGSPAYAALRQDLFDCQLQLKNHRPRNTWFTGFPLARLDHIFVGAPLRARQIHIPSFHLARAASDHFPLVADIELNGQPE
jgi:endonuclease/exonuclease/phosphatase family metal-dependent hydrolase